MPNYGEELVYWYLRLNGFFPIIDFVVHRCPEIKYSTDIDVLAVRFPYVYEEIGGQPEDWDKTLFGLFDDLSLPIGLIAEVKTGKVNIKELFKPKIVEYATGRFGFVKVFKKYSKSISENALIVEPEKFQVAKILFSYRDNERNDQFFQIPLSHVQTFLQNRILEYPKEKFQDRMFFDSIYIQSLIDATVRDREMNLHDAA